MLPEPQNVPALLLQFSFILSVALYVALEFSFPEVCIRFGHDTVNGAAMPEAAINENSHLYFGENNIWPAGKSGVESVTHTACPEGLAQKHLRLCVFALNS